MITESDFAKIKHGSILENNKKEKVSVIVVQRDLFKIYGRIGCCRRVHIIKEDFNDYTVLSF